MNVRSIEQPKAAGAATARYRLQCFGDVRLYESDGAPCTPRSRKARALLAFVALSDGAPVARERLATLLWEDRSDEQARASVRQALYELRALSAEPDPLLSVTREHVAIHPGAINIDLDEAELLARAQDVAALTQRLPKQQLVLLDGLDDVTADFEDWLRAERSRRMERLIALAVTAGQAALRRAEIEPVRALVAALEALDPLSESVVRLGIQADVLCSDSAQAHRRFRRFEERLARELATRPSAETRALLPRIAAPARPADAHHNEAAADEQPTLKPALPQPAPFSRVEAETPRRVPSQKPSSATLIATSLVLAMLAIGFFLFAKEHLATRSSLQDRYTTAQTLIRDRHEPDLLRARALLLEAVELDPTYAAAWASLSIVTMLLSDEPSTYGPIPLAQARNQAVDYANRAVKLDPNLAEAHAAMGLIAGTQDRGIPHLQRAIALDPKRPVYHRWLGQAYADTGKPLEALAEYRLALDADPRWPASATLLIEQLSEVGRENEIDRVVRQFNSTSSVAYDRNVVQFVAYCATGDLLRAVPLGRQMLRQRPDDQSIGRELSAILAALGEREAALAVIPVNEVLRRAIISHDVPQLERIARESPGVFWHDELDDVRAGELLVADGRGQLLLQLFDARYSNLEEFKNDGHSAIEAAPALIVALREAGRRREADDLQKRVLAKIDANRAEGILARVFGFERAQQLALEGHNGQALVELEWLLQIRWPALLTSPFTPLSERVAFRALRDNPRLLAVQEQLNARIQQTRAQLGPI